MTKAIKTTREVIRNKVSTMNLMLEMNNDGYFTEALKRHESEIRGMLIILKNIDEKNFRRIFQRRKNVLIISL